MKLGLQCMKSRYLYVVIMLGGTKVRVGLRRMSSCGNDRMGVMM